MFYRKMAGAYKELEERKKRADEMQNIVTEMSLRKELMVCIFGIFVNLPVCTF
jgi:uncharacterized coiled-coil DUF342 family protein